MLLLIYFSNPKTACRNVDAIIVYLFWCGFLVSSDSKLLHDVRCQSKFVINHAIKYWQSGVYNIVYNIVYVSRWKLMSSGEVTGRVPTIIIYSVLFPVTRMIIITILITSFYSSVSGPQCLCVCALFRNVIGSYATRLRETCRGLTDHKSHARRGRRWCEPTSTVYTYIQQKILWKLKSCNETNVP